MADKKEYPEDRGFVFSAKATQTKSGKTILKQRIRIPIETIEGLIETERGKNANAKSVYVSVDVWEPEMDVEAVAGAIQAVVDADKAKFDAEHGRKPATAGKKPGYKAKAEKPAPAAETDGQDIFEE
jgi:hypothetical protein